MSTVEEVETEPITGELIESPPKEIPIVFNVSDARIQKLREELTGLTIADAESYERVRKGISVCRTLRTSVEKCRKDLKEHALAYGRKVDAEAKRLREALESIEDPLQLEKDRVDEEKAKAKREAEEAKRKIVEARVTALVELGELPNPILVAAWSDDQFQIELNLAWDRFTDRVKAEEEAQAQAAKEEAERQEQLRLEREKIEAEKAELARLRAEESERQRIAEEKRNAEFDRIAKEQAAERKRAAEAQAKIDEANRLEREKIESERRAVQAEKERVDREREAERLARQQAIEREERERRELERREALKPDAEKIRAFAKVLLELPLPQVLTDDAIMFINPIGDRILAIANECEDFGR